MPRTAVRGLGAAAVLAVALLHAAVGRAADGVDDGAPITPEKLPGWLRFARTVRVSIDGNAGLCRGLLETRYGLTRAEP
jgi:hypothetical protein